MIMELSFKKLKLKKRRESNDEELIFLVIKKTVQ